MAIKEFRNFEEYAPPAASVPRMPLNAYPMGEVPDVDEQIKDHFKRNWLKYLLAGGLFGRSYLNKRDMYNQAMSSRDQALNNQAIFRNVLANATDPQTGQIKPEHMDHVNNMLKHIEARSGIMPDRNMSMQDRIKYAGMHLDGLTLQSTNNAAKAATKVNKSLFGRAANMVGLGAGKDLPTPGNPNTPLPPDLSQFAQPQMQTDHAAQAQADAQDIANQQAIAAQQAAQQPQPEPGQATDSTEPAPAAPAAPVNPAGGMTREQWQQASPADITNDTQIDPSFHQQPPEHIDSIRADLHQSDLGSLHDLINGFERVPNSGDDPDAAVAAAAPEAIDGKSRTRTGTAMGRLIRSWRAGKSLGRAGKVLRDKATSSNPLPDISQNVTDKDYARIENQTDINSLLHQKLFNEDDYEYDGDDGDETYTKKRRRGSGIGLAAKVVGALGGAALGAAAIHQVANAHEKNSQEFARSGDAYHANKAYGKANVLRSVDIIHHAKQFFKDRTKEK